jgi:5-methylcytosine-specific restriction endonuclease McrA
MPKPTDITGQKFGRLLAIERTEEKSGTNYKWLCQCECGTQKKIRLSDLLNGKIRSCGCLHKETSMQKLKKISNFKDLTGQRFGKLIAVEREKVKSGSQYKWLCQCDCGNTVWARIDGLQRGDIKSCGCLTRFIDLTGKRFGRLIVIKLESKNKDEAFWLCKCDCGIEKIARGGNLSSGNAKSCGCLVKENNWQRKRIEFGQAAFNAIYYSYKRTAQNRGYEFNLTPMQFRELTQQSCFYCGQPPSNIRKTRSKNGDYIYSGIDRVDNSLDYVYENCVPCCRTCNLAKHTMSQQEFSDWIQRVHHHFILQNVDNQFS